MKKRLLAVQGPIQFVAGYIAMEWYKIANLSSEETETVLFMYDFLMPNDDELEFANVITQLSSFCAWHKIVFMRGLDMTTLMKNNYSVSIAKLHEILGTSNFDEIYLARDYCGNGSPLIINAYPNANKIAYGDSLGLIGNEAEFNNFNWRSPVRSLLSRCKVFVKRLLLGGPKKIPFNMAILTLPMDWSGTYLDKVPFLVPSKEYVINTLSTIYSNLNELKVYCNDLIKCDGTSNKYLFLLSNLSGSDLMSPENEVELYVEVIKQNARLGDLVYLKAHPRNSSKILHLIVKKIETLYKIIIIDNNRLSKFPIELWSDLIENCTIVPVFSTSAIHLKYIYNKSVILPLTEALISDYFFSDKISYMIKANELIDQTITRLERWDGNSVLWKGEI